MTIEATKPGRFAIRNSRSVRRCIGRTNPLHRGAIAFLASWLVVVASQGSADAAEDWRRDWALHDGFAIAVDSEGYDLPTSIAVVPNPGPAPDDPIYFVTELYGSIKVVTNDRTVRTFADGFFELNLPEKLPSLSGENGMAGICLDPASGYVFVTFTYHDADGVLRNNVARFATKAGTFSTSPSAVTFYPDVFLSHPSAQSHQIGPPIVHEGALFVAVGDARHPAASRDLSYPVGKILRMSLDGKPLADNPFYQNDDTKLAANYVWAYGLRNPFSLIAVGSELFAADNGPGVDRFLRVGKGQDYLYDGSDWSMGLRAEMVFAPSPSPVQVAYIPPELEVFPEAYRAKFFLAFSGFVGQDPGPGDRGEKSVVMIDYDPDSKNIMSRPFPFVRYVGKGRQLPVGLGVSKEAMYIVPLFPTRDGKTAVLRVVHDPTEQHGQRLGNEPRDLMASHACFSCHSMVPDVKKLGPTLDRLSLVPRLTRKINDPEYFTRLDELDKTDGANPDFVKARAAVRSARPRERLRVWVKHHILEPRFDNPVSQMPKPTLTEEQAEIIANYLIPLTDQNVSTLSWLKMQLSDRLPNPRLRHVGGAFIAGCGLSLILLILFRLLLRLRAPREVTSI